MLVDTNVIRALGTDCSSQADDLLAAAGVLRSLPGSDALAALGPVGAGFAAALIDAVAAEADAITQLSAELESAHSVSGAVANAYADADRRGGSLL